jgi:hypothetical protein
MDPDYQDFLNIAEYVEQAIKIHQNVAKAQPPSEIIQKRWLDNAQSLCRCPYPDLQKRGQKILEEIQEKRLFRKKTKVSVYVVLVLLVVGGGALLSTFVLSQKNQWTPTTLSTSKLPKKIRETAPPSKTVETKTPETKTPENTEKTWEEMTLEELTELYEQEYDSLSDDDLEELEYLLSEKWEARYQNQDTAWEDLSQAEKEKAERTAKILGFQASAFYNSSGSSSSSLFWGGSLSFGEAWFLSVVPALFTLLLFVIVGVKMQSTYKALGGKITSQADLERIRSAINLDMSLAMIFKVVMTLYLIFMNYWFFTYRLDVSAFLGHTFCLSAVMMTLAQIVKPMQERFRKMKAENPLLASKFNEWILMAEEARFRLPPDS